LRVANTTVAEITSALPVAILSSFYRTVSIEAMRGISATHLLDMVLLIQ